MWYVVAFLAGLIIGGCAVGLWILGSLDDGIG